MSVAEGRPVRPRRRWIWAIVALATVPVLVSPVALLFRQKLGLQHGYGPVTVYHRAVTTVLVRAPGDTVAITAGPPGQVSVSSTLTWLRTMPAVRETWHGTALAVSVRCPARGAPGLIPAALIGNCSASLIVHVPAVTGARVTVGAGAATVSGLAGPVHATATSGSLVLAYLSGPLWATATSGSITGTTGLNSPRLTADVTSGSLALGLDSAPRSLSVAVGSGSGEVTVPPGTRYRVEGGAGSAAQVSPGLSSPDSASLIAAEVGAGELTISYPGGLTG